MLDVDGPRRDLGAPRQEEAQSLYTGDGKGEQRESRQLLQQAGLCCVPAAQDPLQCRGASLCLLRVQEAGLRLRAAVQTRPMRSVVSRQAPHSSTFLAYSLPLPTSHNSPRPLQSLLLSQTLAFEQFTDHWSLLIGWSCTDARIQFRHVDALEAKVRELEQANSNTRTRTLTQYSPAPPQAERSLHASETAQYYTAIPRPSQSARDVDAGQSGIAAKDGILSSPSSPPSQESRRRYGKSSSLHFALNVKASATAMAQGDDLGRDGSRRLSASSLHAPGLDAQSAPFHADGVEDADDDEEDYMISTSGPCLAMSQLLPHRHLAKTLFAKYFEAIHPIWPFLLEAEPRELFSHTWTSEEPPDPLWLVHLNLIMCLGCEHHEADGNDHPFQGSGATGSGKDFYQRAQNMSTRTRLPQAASGCCKRCC